ncbi:MAG: protein kinase [Proteobacteria bacterium]|nr:protein kinase [Pseudomonadota bacterium]
MKRGADRLDHNDVTEDSVPPFFVSDAEWARAEAFFGSQKFGWYNWNLGLLFSTPKLVRKLKKEKGNPNSHTFIEQDGKIIVTANTASEPHCVLGEGGQGKVKLGFMRKGSTVAVKTQKEMVAQLKNMPHQRLKAIRPQDLECQALAHEGLLVGYLHETRPRTPTSQVLEKQYTIMQLVPGEDLQKIDSRELTLQQRLQIAYQCCVVLKHIHAGKFVHGDIKPANIKVQFVGDSIIVKFIDFGFSFKLKDGQIQMDIPASFGSDSYIAPEVSKGYNIGYASDVYSLGVVFSKDLKIPAKIWDGMTSYLSERRPSLDEITNRLQTAIAQTPPQALESTGHKKLKPDGKS